MLDPVINEYDRHDGSVTCVKCSPIQNQFVSAGTDKEIRIYSFDQVYILLTTYNIIKEHRKIITFGSF